MTVKFLFKPLDKVVIHAHGIDCLGRIQSCIKGPEKILRYSVEYADGGKVSTAQFYEDEIRLREEDNEKKLREQMI